VNFEWITKGGRIVKVAVRVAREGASSILPLGTKTLLFLLRSFLTRVRVSHFVILRPSAYASDRSALRFGTIRMTPTLRNEDPSRHDISRANPEA